MWSWQICVYNLNWLVISVLHWIFWWLPKWYVEFNLHTLTKNNKTSGLEGVLVTQFPSLSRPFLPQYFSCVALSLLRTWGFLVFSSSRLWKAYSFPKTHGQLCLAVPALDTFFPPSSLPSNSLVSPNTFALTSIKHGCKLSPYYSHGPHHSFFLP